MKIPHHPFPKRTTLFGEQNYFPLSIFIALLILAPNIYGQQPNGARTVRLSSIEFSGLQRVDKEQAIAASGLQVGKLINIDALDAAAERLLNSGLFTKLSYRLRGTSEQATVTFQVEEAKGGGLPVVFDNFVWFTDEELFNAVRRVVPSFDGTAPESSGVLSSITRALQQLLEERKIQGQVDYTPSATLSGGNPKHVFSVKGVNVKICAVRFPGAAGVPETELVKNSKALFDNEYSQEFVSAFAVANLIPVYRQHGHLRASFRAPSAKAEGCKEGVAVTVPVEEGVSYSWDKAEWAGNDSFTAQELEKPLGMKSGDVANGLKIDAGLMAVQKTYGKKGLLTAQVKAAPVFDDANRRVTYRLLVAEGPRYTMGALIIKGLPEADADRLKERWKLRQGDVYDASYLEEFSKKEIKEFMERVFREGRIRPGSKPPEIGSSIKLNRQALNVDVTIEFKNLDL